MIKVLALIGRLLDYPTAELIQHKAEVLEALRTTPYLPPELRRNLMAHVEREFAQDLYDLQARYDGLFDRGRSLSLLLFEHVHGESRDRGQAMVDLLNVYQEAGLLPRSDQLPDYLPLFLEFLSTRDEDTAAQWLGNVSHILLLLAERLRKRAAWEADLFDALLVIGGGQLADDRVQAQVAAEEDDCSLAALDRDWEDKEIRFDTDAESACPTPPQRVGAAMQANNVEERLEEALQQAQPQRWHNKGWSSKPRKTSETSS